jgi:hypothetical protein
VYCAQDSTEAADAAGLDLGKAQHPQRPAAGIKSRYNVSMQWCRVLSACIAAEFTLIRKTRVV